MNYILLLAALVLLPVCANASELTTELYQFERLTDMVPAPSCLIPRTSANAPAHHYCIVEDFIRRDLEKQGVRFDDRNQISDIK